MGQRVIVAMSGGVDSSVTAALLHCQGYEVIGVGLRFPELSPQSGRRSTCCGPAGLQDALWAAAQIGIPFYTFNYEGVFQEQVIDPFCRAYAVGQTPNPCIDCNAEIKFGRLMQTAWASGADYLATGHYARIDRSPSDGGLNLLKADDRRHDQSYFLYRLTPEQLERVRFPLGTLHKTTVRRLAREMGLHVAEKPGSQDICFLQGAHYQSFLAQRCPEAFREGDIIDSRGEVLGRHRGIAAYTVGQRRGLGIAAPQPLYVKQIDTVNNRLLVDRKERLLVRELSVEQINWTTHTPPALPASLSVKVRYRAPEVPAEIAAGSNGGVRVRFERPQPPVAPGQAAVFYDGDLVLGGGVITACTWQG